MSALTRNRVALSLAGQRKGTMGLTGGSGFDGAAHRTYGGTGLWWMLVLRVPQCHQGIGVELAWILGVTSPCSSPVRQRRNLTEGGG